MHYYLFLSGDVLSQGDKKSSCTQLNLSFLVFSTVVDQMCRRKPMLRDGIGVVCLSGTKQDLESLTHIYLVEILPISDTDCCL